MKLTGDTRINAILYVEENKGTPLVIQSQDMNMTLNEYISRCAYTSILENNPIPVDILDMDFNVENVHTNSHGHRFTVLGYKNPKTKKVCVINKLDLAGTY